MQSLLYWGKLRSEEFSCNIDHTRIAVDDKNGCRKLYDRLGKIPDETVADKPPQSTSRTYCKYVRQAIATSVADRYSSADTSV